MVESLAFMLIPGFSAIAFFSAIEPLRIANRLANRSLYSWSVHCPAGDHARASNGMQIRAEGPVPDNVQSVIVCAGFDPLQAVSRALLGQLRRTWRGGMRLGAIDTGAFILAEAGILGNEMITLHWEAVGEFNHRYPHISVSTELYERHARLFTCAGGTAAMDMMLDAIAASHGVELANAVSEQLIHDRIRRPSDPQRIPLAQQAASAGPIVQRVIAEMERSMTVARPVAAIVRAAGINRRLAERHFAARLGCTPARYYREMRLKQALGLIRNANLPVHEAALAAGFSSQPVFSRACKQHFGKSPRELLEPHPLLPDQVSAT
jgi:transcriptional regulator GlxA family with amidase domain